MTVLFDQMTVLYDHVTVLFVGHGPTYQSRPKIASIYSTLCVFIDETLRFFEKNTHIVCIYRIDGLNFGRDTFVGYKIRR